MWSRPRLNSINFSCTKQTGPKIDPEPVRTPEGDGVEWSTGHVRRAVRLSSVHGRHGVENLHWLPDIPNLET
jgi:hypothetical protein